MNIDMYKIIIDESYFYKNNSSGNSDEELLESIEELLNSMESDLSDEQSNLELMEKILDALEGNEYDKVPSESGESENKPSDEEQKGRWIAGTDEVSNTSIEDQESDQKDRWYN